MRRETPLLTLALAAALAAIPVAAQERVTTVRELTLDDVLATPSVLEPKLPRLEWIGETTLLATIEAGARGERAGWRDAAADDDWHWAFTAVELARALEAGGAPGAASAEGASAHLPPFTWLDRTHVRVARKDGVYRWEIGTPRASRVLAAPEGAERAAFAKDDRAGAFVVDHQIVVADASGTRCITDDGSEDVVYGAAAHREEFGIHDGMWWDPTGRWLAFSREDQRPIDAYPYANYAQSPPVPVHGRYPMAGRADAIVTIGVYDSQDDSVRYLENDPAADLYWTNVTFAPDGKAIYVALVTRAQDRMQLARFDTVTGRLDRELLVEEDARWIEPTQGPIFVPGGDGAFLWFSPRDGHRHLCLYERDGKLVRQVTRGPADVRDCLGFTPHGRALVMAASDDPCQMHLWTVDMEGRSTRLTEARGWHECKRGANGALVLDRYSHLELPGAVDVIDVASGAAERLATAADPAEGYRRAKPERFTVRADDGTVLHGLLLVPPDATEHPERKLPVLQYVYGGPQSQLVRDRWLGGANPWLHFMAGRGYVVFLLDNRGTDNRGIAFAQSVFRRLTQLEAQDQARALAHVCALPYADAARAGVHGWSFGGTMTLALLLRHPRAYACGIAGAPVTDWAQYETGYTERYMDTPQENPEGYAAANAVLAAEDLEARLLLIHGTDDRTVMWSHAMRFVQACVDAGKLVDFMAYPMQRHGLVGPARTHLYHLMTRYFDEHLRR
jgi:dipeptidyl-peptidase-4